MQSYLSYSYSCTPPSAGLTIFLGTLLAAMCVWVGSAIGFNSNPNRDFRNGVIGGIIGALIAATLSAGIYAGFNADYNRCEQRERITVTS